jgi:hypothetical protein
MIIGIAALLCATICSLIAGFIGFEVIDLVNAKLPEKEQFDWGWWYTEKTLRLHREYRRLYPGGRHLVRIHILEVVVYSCMVLVAWGLWHMGR